MFRQMKIDLGNNYSINASKEKNDIAIKVYNDQKIIGKACLTTDKKGRFRPKRP